MTKEQKFVAEYIELCKKHGLQLEARDYEGMCIGEYSLSDYSDGQALLRGVGLIPEVKVECKHSLDTILQPYTTPLLNHLTQYYSDKGGNFTWVENES